MTIAQQLKIKDFPFVIDDKNGREIYYEDSFAYWIKYEYDANGNKLEYTHNMTIAQQLKIKEFPFKIKDKNGKEIYYQSANGFWLKREWDANGKEIYFETSRYWVKREYDDNGNLIYWEDSDGAIKDKRPKTDVQKAIELLTKEGLIVDGKILKN